MVRRQSGRRGLVLCTVLAILAFALPAAAQGLVQGTVLDTKGQPVEGAAISIEQEGTNRKFDMKTDKKGGFMQIGLASASYKITATKDKLTASETVKVSQGRPANAKLVLGAAAAAAAGAEAAAVTALRKLLDEAIAASNAGKHDEAIAGFTKAIEGNPTCFACYYNIGYNYAQKKDYANAETNYKKAIEMKADYVDAYAGLASIYNAQRKFDEAAAASAKATEFSSTLGGANTRGRRRRRLLQPGRHPLERRQGGGGQEVVRVGDSGQPEPCRSALPARDGAGERGQPRRRGDRVRNLPEARTGRSQRRNRQGTRRTTEEVVLDSAALRARLADVRDRIARAAGRARRDPASIRLVAISKTFDAEHVRAAAETGQVDFGENKVQEGLQKMERTAGVAASLASGRPPAIEQGPKSRRPVRHHSFG